MEKNNKIIHASAIGLIKDNQVLLCRRPQGKDMAGMLEFPGGKLEKGEMPSDALVREIKEEIGIDIDISSLVPITFTEHHYPNLFQVVLYFFACHNWQGQLQELDNQENCWFDISKISTLTDIVPADIYLAKSLQSYIKHKQ